MTAWMEQARCLLLWVESGDKGALHHAMCMSCKPWQKCGISGNPLHNK